MLKFRLVPGFVALVSAVTAAALVGLPLGSAQETEAHLDLSASMLANGSGVGIRFQHGSLTLASDAPSSLAYAAHPAFGIAESAPLALAGGSAVRHIELRAEVPAGAAVRTEIRGQRRGQWTEWVQGDELPTLDGIDVVQSRLTLLAAQDGQAPRVQGVGIETAPLEMRAFDAVMDPAPTVRLWATRVGLVGQTTANGHVVQERDRFVALPSKRVLNARGARDYEVQLTYGGRSVIAPVWDVGPWNMRDDYWNDSREGFADLPRWTPQAEAAFFADHNGGRDGFGRFVTVPTSIDLADGTYLEDLGLGDSDWIDVTFLWLRAPSPAPRTTLAVVPKTPPPAPVAEAALGVSQPRMGAPPERAASYNASAPATRVHLPQVVSEPGARKTTWTVQNTAGFGASGTVDLYELAGALAGTLQIELPPAGAASYTVADVPGVTIPFRGSGVITASAPIAVVANEDLTGTDLLAYEGVATGAPLLAAPLLFKEYRGWSTSLAVQNLGPVPTDVQVTFTNGTGATWSESATVLPLASASFVQGQSQVLPKEFTGSARIFSSNGQPLALVVNVLHVAGAGMAYTGLTGGSDRLNAPLVFKGHNGWDSGIQVTNLSPVGGSLLIRYPEASTAIQSVPISPFGSATVYVPANAQLPAGFVGSAVIQGPSGASLVGIVNQAKPGARTAMSYAIGGDGTDLSQLALPVVAADADGWSTGVQLQQPQGGASEVQIRFYRENGELALQLDETLPGGSLRTLYPPSLPQLGAGFRGSAQVLTLTGPPPVAVVNEMVR